MSRIKHKITWHMKKKKESETDGLEKEEPI